MFSNHFAFFSRDLELTQRNIHCAVTKAYRVEVSLTSIASRTKSLVVTLVFAATEMRRQMTKAWLCPGQTSPICCRVSF